MQNYASVQPRTQAFSDLKCRPIEQNSAFHSDPICSRALQVTDVRRHPSCLLASRAPVHVYSTVLGVRAVVSGAFVLSDRSRLLRPLFMRRADALQYHATDDFVPTTYNVPDRIDPAEPDHP